METTALTLHNWLADFPFVTEQDRLNAIRLARAVATNMPSEIFVIEGPAAAGKSLLAKTLLAVTDPEAAAQMMPTSAKELDRCLSRLRAQNAVGFFDNVERVPMWPDLVAVKRSIQIVITSNALMVPDGPQVTRIRLDRAKPFDPTTARHPDVKAFTVKHAEEIKKQLLARPDIQTRQQISNVLAEAWEAVRFFPGARSLVAYNNRLYKIEHGLLCKVKPSEISHMLIHAANWYTLRKARPSDVDSRNGMVEIACDPYKHLPKLMRARPAPWIPKVVGFQLE